MAALQNSVPSLHHTLFLNSFPQKGLQKHNHGAFSCCKRGVSVHVRAEQSTSAAASSSSAHFQDSCRRRQLIAAGITAPLITIVDQTPFAFAAETKKGFLSVTDKKDGYSFLYPFGWQEVVIEGQDKVFKDVIEPLESVSVNVIPTSKQDIRDFGAPQEVAETLIKKVLAPSNQKTKLIGAKEHEADGKTYYTFEFVAQAPTYIRHALSAVCIGNGKFYTLTTGANERRWGKMKDRLLTVVDSFQIFNV
ncbi:Photosystem II PsbP, oxygen evolving complex [Corchorus olitorius]|uniref:Photosystem II PsbP, oxygen evolving complex n=1 Tax=Corchorus olitorius TaxID=93759 RepID=A0A1R3JQA0_9ROSI|nr:Photosystem II PsbP, oxygen evolving complex [Corchorus olitorius]